MAEQEDLWLEAFSYVSSPAAAIFNQSRPERYRPASRLSAASPRVLETWFQAAQLYPVAVLRTPVRLDITPGLSLGNPSVVSFPSLATWINLTTAVVSEHGLR
jgi:hypothetical protein